MDVTVKPTAECGVVILGGTAGVGLETARHFALEGSRIVLLGRDPERGASAVARCRDEVPGARVDFVAVDAADAFAAVRAEEECRARLGAIDVLVCSSGIHHPPRLLDDVPVGGLGPRLDELVLPPVHMVHAVLPAMRRQRGGAIVVLASDAAKVATPGESIQGAAMAALVQFCRAVALEAKREGVRVNALTPSLVANTPGAQVVFSEPFSARLFEKATARAHLGLAEPEDLARMIVFLAGPAGRRITGQAISITGGISAA